MDYPRTTTFHAVTVPVPHACVCSCVQVTDVGFLPHCMQCTTFSDAGGFVFHLPELKKVIANAGGTYIELETGANPHYDSTGLQRVHINTCGTQPASHCAAVHPLIGPSAGPAQEMGGVAVGVFWELEGAGITSLGNQTHMDVKTVRVTPGADVNSSHVVFTVEYLLEARGVTVTEMYSITSARVNVTASIALHAEQPSLPVLSGSLSSEPPAARITRVGVSFPVLLFDGATNTNVTLPAAAVGALSPAPPPQQVHSAASASVTATDASGHTWGTQTFTVFGTAEDNPLTCAFNASVKMISRNGVLGAVHCERSLVRTALARISYSITGSGVAGEQEHNLSTVSPIDGFAFPVTAVLALLVPVSAALLFTKVCRREATVPGTRTPPTTRHCQWWQQMCMLLPTTLAKRQHQYRPVPKPHT